MDKLDFKLPAPWLIGIAGPSCSGKTELARHLGRLLPAKVIGLDSYYHDLSHLSFHDRCRANFDDPGALDRNLLLQHLRLLAKGEAIEKPVYDFKHHVRPGTVERFEPGEFVIVEGLFALLWGEVRELLGTKIYVSAPDEVCFVRRRERDIRERGRTVESVIEQYNATVRPMAERYILPTREFADLVVSGTDPLERSLEAVLANVEQKLGRSLQRAVEPAG